MTAIWCVALYSLALPISIRLTETYHLVTATRHFAFGGNSKRNGCSGLCHRFECFLLQVRKPENPVGPARGVAPHEFGQRAG